MLRLAATTAVSLGREATIIAWTGESAKSGKLWVLGQFEIQSVHSGKSCPSEVSVRIKEIEHVQLAMPRGKESEARNFYEGVLGIPEVAKPPNLAKRGGCWFVRDKLRIHLGVENDFRAARKAHPALLVEDLPALKTVIKAAGYSFNTDEPLEGYDRIYVNDPFGNRIELMEPLSN
jgi:catechol 2,3-dioxygenase-like lactoylglutathione lyase family enzyme